MAWGSQGGEPLAESGGLAKARLDLSGGRLSDDVAHRGFEGMEEVLGFLFGSVGSGTAGEGIEWGWVIWALGVLIGDQELKPCDARGRAFNGCYVQAIKESGDFCGLYDGGGASEPFNGCAAQLYGQDISRRRVPA